MREEDATLIVNWRNRPEDASSYRTPRKLTLEEHLQWFRSPRPGRIDYVIELRNERRCIGTIHFKNISHAQHSAESGRLIGDPDCRGRGFGRESAVAWFRYGFEQLGLRQIYGITHASNVANIALNRSLGSQIINSGTSEEFVKMVLRLEDAQKNGLLD